MPTEEEKKNKETSDNNSETKDTTPSNLPQPPSSQQNDTQTSDTQQNETNSLLGKETGAIGEKTTKEEPKDSENGEESKGSKETEESKGDNGGTEVTAVTDTSEKDTERYEDTLKTPEYYHTMVEEYRKDIESISSLRALIESMPTNDTFSDGLASKNDSVKKKTIEVAKKWCIKWNDYASKNSQIAFWYQRVVTENYTTNGIFNMLHKVYGKDSKAIGMVLGLTDLNNQDYILKHRAELSMELEEYKQHRDMALFVNSMKESGKGFNGVDLKNTVIYNFKFDGKRVYGYLDGNNNFVTFKNKDEFVKGAVDNAFYWTNKGKEESKNSLDDKFNRKIEKIKAQEELSQRLDNSGLTDYVNLATITEYLNFNEDEFNKRAAEYRAAQIATAPKATDEENSNFTGEGHMGMKNAIKETIKDNAADISIGAAGVVQSAADTLSSKTSVDVGKLNLNIGLNLTTDANTFLDHVADNDTYTDLGDKIQFIDKDNKKVTLNKADVFKGLCISGGIGLAKCPLAAVEMLKTGWDIKAATEEIMQLDKVCGGGVFSEATQKRLETAGLIGKDLVIKFAATAAEATSNISKIAVGAGKMSVKTLGDVMSVADGISGGLDVFTGAADVGMGIYEIAKSTHDKNQAEAAENGLDKFGTKRTAKNKMFLRQVGLNARKNRANAILDTVTGGLDMAAGIVSLIPGVTTVVGTGISLASKAISFIGKFAISKYFKSKSENQIWTDILQFSSVEEYKEFNKKIGSDKKFHNVLRRKTGIGKREHFAQAFNIMNAIDIYTTAKLHSGDKNGKNTDERIAQQTLSGIGYTDPSNYKYLKLENVLSKIDAEKGWKNTLKDSITDTTSGEKKEDHGLTK